MVRPSDLLLRRMSAWQAALPVSTDHLKGIVGQQL